MQETDENLYFRYLTNGDSEDLRILLERYSESLTLFINGYVHNMEDAEELMLDAFAIVASGMSRFKGKSSFKTWLFAIGRNLAFKHIKRHRIQIEPLNEETVQAEEQAEAELKLLKEERNAMFYSALKQLNPDYRQAIYLVYFEDMSIEEAALVMGKGRKQFYNLVSRARASMKRILERMGISDEEF